MDSAPRIVIGVDPGLSGAAAVVAFNSAGRPTHADFIDMPTADLKTSATGKNFRLLLPSSLYWELADSIRGLPFFPVEAWIEQVSAMPGQGVSSTFAFGRGFGATTAVLDMLGAPVRYVRPAVWKRILGLDSLKSSSLTMAREHMTACGLDPEFDLARVCDEGRAEAYLLAVYGYAQGQGDHK